MRMPLFFINNTRYCAVFPILPSIEDQSATDYPTSFLFSFIARLIQANVVFDFCVVR